MQEAQAADGFNAKAAAALSSPARLAIANELAGGERSAGDLMRALSLPQPQVSQHLAVMRAAGLVAVEWRGGARIYHLAEPAVARAHGCVAERLVSVDPGEDESALPPPAKSH